MLSTSPLMGNGAITVALAGPVGRSARWMGILMIEAWRTTSIPGYEVSDQGRVRRVAGGRGARAGRILQCWISSRGYVMASLSNCGQSKHYRVHRLVTSAFMGPVPAGFQVNHRNGKKTDNRLSNLEYVSPRENIRHAIAHSLFGS